MHFIRNRQISTSFYVKIHKFPQVFPIFGNNWFDAGSTTDLINKTIANTKKLGRLGVKTIAYYIGTSLCAIIIGLTLTNLIQPGKGVQSVGSEKFNYSEINTERSVGDILIDMIPTNPISSIL